MNGYRVPAKAPTWYPMTPRKTLAPLVGLIHRAWLYRPSVKRSDSLSAISIAVIHAIETERSRIGELVSGTCGGGSVGSYKVNRLAVIALRRSIDDRSARIRFVQVPRTDQSRARLVVNDGDGGGVAVLQWMHR